MINDDNILEAILCFIHKNRSPYLFPDWTIEQIASYLYKYFIFNKVRYISDKNNKIIGVTVHEEISPYTIYIVHFVTDKEPETFRIFLKALNNEYPLVEYLLFKRRFKKQVLMPVNRLNSLKGLENQ